MFEMFTVNMGQEGEGGWETLKNAQSYLQTRDMIFSLFLIKFLRKIYAKGTITKENSSSTSLCLETKCLSLC